MFAYSKVMTWFWRLCNYFLASRPLKQGQPFCVFTQDRGPVTPWRALLSEKYYKIMIAVEITLQAQWCGTAMYVDGNPVLRWKDGQYFLPQYIFQVYLHTPVCKISPQPWGVSLQKGRLQYKNLWNASVWTVPSQHTASSYVVCILRVSPNWFSCLCSL